MRNTRTTRRPLLREREKQRQRTQLTGPRIRCPLCEWRPSAEDLWGCLCGHAWHTFDTGGVCPACLHQWKVTQCHSCNGWPAHSDWYEY
ncbi:MAG: hypothetical protein IT166_19570 [Bryobacterales bacterium]|nr:hypothetical protein [Bryobacterales bacterium]